MIVSWSRGTDGRELITISMTRSDLIQVAGGFGVIDLAPLGGEAEHLRRTQIVLTGPMGGEVILKQAVENRDAGVDVSYRFPDGDPRG
jgi:hypothetical protein